MAGAIAIIVVLALFPVVIGISGGVASAILGFFLQRDGEIRHEGSEMAALDD
jgi:NH3-dependent NAD+ synthetase